MEPEPSWLTAGGLLILGFGLYRRRPEHILIED
jgi:hypothetical protein